MVNTLNELKFQNAFSLTCDYLLGFQVEHKRSESILKKNWAKNAKDVEDDPYDQYLFT
jgi:hypothetical protein